MEFLKKIIYLVSFFVFLNIAEAVVINELAVDPQQDWDGSGAITTTDEWIEIYNDGSAGVDLTGWVLKLVDTTNETETLSGIINANSYLAILNPAGQQNNDGRIELRDSSNHLIDSLSYGNYDDGNTADNEPDGNADSVNNECLARVGADFVKQKCTKGYSNSMDLGNSVSFVVNAFVEGSAPTIYSIGISPDDSSKAGIQVSPVPGSNKTIEVTASVSDAAEVYADILKEGSLVYRKNLELSGLTEYIGTFNMKSTDSAGNYTLRVSASNIEGDTTSSSYFEYLGFVGVEVDTAEITFSSLTKGQTSYIIGDNDILTEDKPTIKNIGNIAIDAEISGTALSEGNKSISIDNLKYRFGAMNYLPLSVNPATSQLNLDAGSKINLDLGLFVPDTARAGTYSGSVLITALG